jgi:hypothetical protein
MFVRSKVIDGKKRRYLVESCRDKTTGNIYQRHIAYVDLWPDKDIARLIGMIKAFREAWADSERAEHTKAFRRVALDKAAKLDGSIREFKRDMRINLTPSRNKVDRRRLDQDTGVRHLQYARDSKTAFYEWWDFILRAGGKVRRMENELAMAEWSDDDLESFIHHSEFVHAKHEEAKRMLNARTKK